MAKVVSETADEMSVWFSHDEIMRLALGIDSLSVNPTDRSAQAFDTNQSMISAIAFVNRCITAMTVRNCSVEEAFDIVNKQQVKLIKFLLKDLENQ